MSLAPTTPRFFALGRRARGPDPLRKFEHAFLSKLLLVSPNNRPLQGAETAATATALIYNPLEGFRDLLGVVDGARQPQVRAVIWRPD
jgi:hypothetical protein